MSGRGESVYAPAPVEDMDMDVGANTTGDDPHYHGREPLLVYDELAGSPDVEVLKARRGSGGGFVSAAEEVDPEDDPARARALLLAFFAMIAIGLGNKIFQVLMTIPMANYSLFVNLVTTFFYLPASFAYICPMIRYGSQITPEEQAVPKKVFGVIGLLDSVAGIMQVVAVTKMNSNGSLIVLLQQAAIPISMIISKLLLKVRYKRFQVAGACVVGLGLVVVLIPEFSKPGGDVMKYAPVMILSCVPMCLSSVYKEKALVDTEMDPVYLNGWIAVFQFIASIPLLLPSAPLADIAIKDLPDNLLNGAKCFVGHNSITHGDDADDCSTSTMYTCIYLFFNVNYNILIILILKFGSSNILWLAMTVMVPMANVAFAFHFMPKHKALKPTDILGLIIIMSGLIAYRFYDKLSLRLREYIRDRREARIRVDSHRVELETQWHS